MQIQHGNETEGGKEIYHDTHRTFIEDCPNHPRIGSNMMPSPKLHFTILYGISIFPWSKFTVYNKSLHSFLVTAPVLPFPFGSEGGKRQYIH